MRIFVSYDTDHPVKWVLEVPYERQTSIGQVIVPKGFETDLASVPRQIWLRLPRWGPWSGAAIVHDWLYRTQLDGVTRLQADNIFRDLMREDKVRVRDIKVIYFAVREFGDGPWRRARRQKQFQQPEVQAA